MRDKLKNMDAETMTFSTINMNSFSDAPSLQGTLEQPLEKKSGQFAVMCKCVQFRFPLDVQAATACFSVMASWTASWS